MTDSGFDPVEPAALQPEALQADVSDALCGLRRGD